MENGNWKAAERDERAEAASFPCLHRTLRGRFLHCRELRRVVIVFLDAYLVLRMGEFHRLLEHLRRIAGCSRTRSRMEGGERIRLRDLTDGKALLLDHRDLLELVELMGIGASSLETRPAGGVWQLA